MRTDVRVSDEKVVAIVLGDVAEGLTHPIAEIRRAISAANFGKVSIVKDFLKTGEVGTEVTRNKNSRRRKCDVIYQNKLDCDQCELLENG